MTITGSTVEGTSLARLFHPSYTDLANAAECEVLEIDVMISLSVMLGGREPEMWTTSCDGGNDLFVHIQVHDKAIEKHGTCPGVDQLARFQDGNYLLSTSIFKHNLVQLFVALTRPLDSSCVSMRHCTPKDAAMSNDLRIDQTCVDGDGENLHEVDDELVRLCVEFKRRLERKFAEVELLNCDIGRFGASDSMLAEHCAKVDRWLVGAEECTKLIYDFYANIADRMIPKPLHWLLPVIRLEFENQRNAMLNSVIGKIALQLRQVTSTNEPDSQERIEQFLISLSGYVQKFNPVITVLKMLYEPLDWMIQLHDGHSEIMEQEPKHNTTEDEILQSASRLSIDLVPFVAWQFWPELAQEWAIRRRHWPKRKTVEQIVKNGVQLIGKEHSHPDLDWRWSFSVAEMRLIELWSADELFAYFIFKGIFYWFIKPLNPKGVDQPNYFPSYLAKTVMLWTSERFPQIWWRADNHGECLTVLVTCLMSAFECRRLDHYFVSSANLLSGIPEQFTDSAAAVLWSLLRDPLSAAKKMECSYELLKKLLKVMDYTAKKASFFESTLRDHILSKFERQSREMHAMFGDSVN